jgi:cobaltochelatase CobN
VAEPGLCLVCVGCCCGHAERGGPKTAPRALKAEIRRAYRASGLAGTVRLAFSECLGPCSEANVAFLYLHGRPLWLRRMGDRALYADLFAYAGAAAAGAASLPVALAARAFRWTGGGPGPEPPVADPAEARGETRA